MILPSAAFGEKAPSPAEEDVCVSIMRDVFCQRLSSERSRCWVFLILYRVRCRKVMII